jgi:hypothetical protein
MAGTRYTLSIENGTITPQGLAQAHTDRAKSMQSWINLLTGIDAGNWRAGRVELHTGAGTGSGTAASQTVTYSGSSGAQTVVIGGTSVAFTAGATDAATVQNAIAAIRAHAVASGLVFVPTPPQYGATINTLAVLTVWANTLPRANTLANGTTFTVTGTGATAGGATMTGGVNAPRNGFDV